MLSSLFTMETREPGYTTGRPSKYDHTYVERAYEYYQACKKSQRMPYIEKLAIDLEIDDDTINDWSKKYEDFSATIKLIHKLQKYLLQQGGLSNQTNVTMSIFLLKANHGMIETEKIQHSTENGKPISINVIGGGYTGYIPEPRKSGVPSAGSNMGHTPLQGSSMAPESEKDIHVDNRTGETSNT